MHRPPGEDFGPRGVLRLVVVGGPISAWQTLGKNSWQEFLAKSFWRSVSWQALAKRLARACQEFLPRILAKNSCQEFIDNVRQPRSLQMVPRSHRAHVLLSIQSSVLVLHRSQQVLLLKRTHTPNLFSRVLTTPLLQFPLLLLWVLLPCLWMIYILTWMNLTTSCPLLLVMMMKLIVSLQR